jgi:hypothetical protein
MKRLTLHRLTSSLSTLYKSMQTLQLNRAKHVCEGKDDDIFWLCKENYPEITNFLEIANGIHRFYALIFVLLKR